MASPEQDVELVKRSIETLLAGDEEAALELLHEDWEFESRFAAIEGRVYRGLPGAREYLADIEDAWSSFQRELIEIVPLEDGVFTVLNIRAVARTSGVAFDQRVGLVYRLRDGLIAGMVSYMDVDDARAAVGLAREAED